MRTVSRGHKLVADGWALFEKTCSEVGAGELPQLLRYVKQATTPTPLLLHPLKWRRRRQWTRVHQRKSRCMRSQSTLRRGGKHCFTGVPIATSPPRSPEWVWTPISVLSTRRSLSCAPSANLLHITWIRLPGTRRSTSRSFFGVDLG